jgi:uncharacterized protein (DUF58 family)
MLSKEILKKIKRLEIRTSRLVEGAVAGGYLSTFKGRGIEFTEVREYSEGDDVRAIDWNVTARMGTPYVKTFMEERDLTVMLLVDLSGSMDFGATGQTKAALAVDFCAAAGLLAAKNNDRVGLLAYTDRVESFIPPRKGKRHIMRLLMELSTLKPKGTGTDLGPAAGFLMKTVRSRATLFWLSDFMGIPDARPIKAAAGRHELIPVLLRDRLEDGLPTVGYIELSDPETGDRLLVDTSSPAFSTYLEDALETREDARSALFRGLKTEPLLLWTGASPITPLARYFRRQARLRRH